MNEKIFDIILLVIPILGAILTGFIVPFIKSKIDAQTLSDITMWVERAVKAAEVLFDTPQSGEEKREYVINFIDKMFNKDGKVVITREQIRVLLEAVCKEMNEAKDELEMKQKMLIQQAGD